MLQTDQMNHFNSLLPGQTGEEGPSRRTALKTALGVGYAATVGAAIAQTAIKTPSEGLTTGEISVEVNGFKVPAYRAAPAGKTNLPVVLVIQEIFGVHEYIADVTRRWAKLGYLAIAADLYARQGDASQYGEISKLMSELVSKVPDAQVAGDLDGVVRWAAANGGDVSRMGVTGFCWGGRQTWLYAAHGPVKAAVAFYGPLLAPPDSLRPQSPLDIVGSLKAPVLGLYGAADQGIPLDVVEKMKAALAGGNAAAKASQIVVYEGAPHGFHADYRPSYRKEAAEDGWKRAQAWFKANGVA